MYLFSACLDPHGHPPQLSLPQTLPMARTFPRFVFHVPSSTCDLPNVEEPSSPRHRRSPSRLIGSQGCILAIQETRKPGSTWEHLNMLTLHTDMRAPLHYGPPLFPTESAMRGQPAATWHFCSPVVQCTDCLSPGG